MALGEALETEMKSDALCSQSDRLVMNASPVIVLDNWLTPGTQVLHLQDGAKIVYVLCGYGIT